MKRGRGGVGQKQRDTGELDTKRRPLSCVRENRGRDNREGIVAKQGQRDRKKLKHGQSEMDQQ